MEIKASSFKLRANAPKGQKRFPISNFDFEETDYRPAGDFSNIGYLEIDNFKAELADGVKAAVFAPDVKRRVIRNSLALEQ